MIKMYEMHKHSIKNISEKYISRQSSSCSYCTHFDRERPCIHADFVKRAIKLYLEHDLLPAISKLSVHKHLAMSFYMLKQWD